MRVLASYVISLGDFSAAQLSVQYHQSRLYLTVDVVSSKLTVNIKSSVAIQSSGNHGTHFRIFHSGTSIHDAISGYVAISHQFI
jgi:hypothetical protein